MTGERIDPAQHTYEDGFRNPPTPYLPSGEVDLNTVAKQSRAGLRRPVMTVEEALSAEGGYHNSHMVNPERHPVEPGQEVDLPAIQAAFKAVLAAESDEDVRP